MVQYSLLSIQHFPRFWSHGTHLYNFRIPEPIIIESLLVPMGQVSNNNVFSGTGGIAK